MSHDQNDGHSHDHDHDHGHGHSHDQGVKGALRYLRWAPKMWRSSLNVAVVSMVDPQDGEVVVDIGAGMGPGVVAAARTGATVVGVEPTPFMRRVLSMRRLGQRNRRRIDVIDGAAEHIPVADRSVDAIWAVNTMHHWVDPAAAATEIARVLRPGARLLLVDEDFDDPAHPDHEAFGSRHEGDHGFSMVDAQSMGKLLTDAGLAAVEASKRTVEGRPAIVVSVGVADLSP